MASATGIEIDISTPTAFKSRQEIEDFNRKGFPKIQEETHDPTPTSSGGESDPAKAAKLILQKKFFAFSEIEKESSTLKVAEFRQRLKDIKGRINDEKTVRHPKDDAPEYVNLVKTVLGDIELITSQEGSLPNNL